MANLGTSTQTWFINRKTPQAGYKVIDYADDVVIAVPGKFHNTLRDILQVALGKFDRWARCSSL